MGRMVLARIYKIDDVNGTKRFNASCRQALVVYGVQSVSRDTLQEGAQIEAVILGKAGSDDKWFAQIKGSYLKVKVKNVPGNAAKHLKEGDTVIAALTSVTKQKIVAKYEGKSAQIAATGQTEDELKVQKLWLSIEEEAQKDIQAMVTQASKQEIDIQGLQHLAERPQDEVDQQLRDLKELGQDDDDSMEVV